MERLSEGLGDDEAEKEENAGKQHSLGVLSLGRDGEQHF